MSLSTKAIGSMAWKTEKEDIHMTKINFIMENGSMIKNMESEFIIINKDAIMEAGLKINVKEKVA